MACLATAKELCRSVRGRENWNRSTLHILAKSLHSELFVFLSVVRATLRQSWVWTCPWARRNAATPNSSANLRLSHEVNGKPQLVVASASEVGRLSVSVPWHQNRSSRNAFGRIGMFLNDKADGDHG